MKNAQKPDHVSLTTLLSWLREGRYVVPDFQREFEWTAADIRDLVRSIFLDYYIGSLLLWKGKKENFEALSCEAIYGFTGSGRQHYIVLDGQQRLTAMHYAFHSPPVPLPNRASQALYSIRIDRLMEERYDTAFEYDWRSKRTDDLFSNSEEQFASHVFPCSVIGAGGGELYRWIDGYREYWQLAAQNAEHASSDGDLAIAQVNVENAGLFEDLLQGITQQYQVAYIELDEDLEIDKVCDIFTQVNSKGVRLDVFDLMNALLKPNGLQLKHMWRAAAPKLEFIDTARMNVYVLQVMSILAQTYCSPKYLYFLLPGQAKPTREKDGSRHKEVLVADVTAFETLWKKAVEALERAIELLKHPQEFGAISAKYLPYVSILPVFSALQMYVSEARPEVRSSGQRKVRHWYWASVFTNRYSGSVESTSARDYGDIQKWIEDDNAEPALIQEFKDGFTSLDLRSETRSGTSVYNGVFNLLVLGRARDWITDNITPPEELDDHHIVPVSWGARHLDGQRIHTILNRSPLSAETNRNVIGNNLPNVYLREMINRNGEDDVRRTLESHLVSSPAFDMLLRDPFGPDDFEDFIAERQRTIQEAIETLLVKERLELPINLRELDRQVELVELALRRSIDEAFGGDVGRLPSHMADRIQERLDRAERKNPAFDKEYSATLAGKLEYSDLRELQIILEGKQSWSLFADLFQNRTTLTVRFDQLAELRNSLRHSRTTGDITIKDGEASVLWFQQALKH